MVSSFSQNFIESLIRLTNTSHSTAATRVQTSTDGRNSPKSPTLQSDSTAAKGTAATVDNEANESNTRSQGEGVEAPVVKVTEMEVETEASRLYFKRYLLAEADLEKTAVKAEAPDAKRPASGLMKTRKSKTPEGKKGFVIASHVVDFSNVVSGTSRTKKFRLTNTGHVPVSFASDKNLTSSHGFTMEPEKIVRLPEGEFVDFTVVFQAKKSIPLGPIAVELPLYVKNGPALEGQCDRS